MFFGKYLQLKNELRNEEGQAYITPALLQGIQN